MPSWKKVITSGSNASLSSLYTSGDVSSSATITAEDLTASGKLRVEEDQSRLKTVLVNPDAVSTGDFRVKSQNLNHVLYTDANKDRVGIGWNNPAGSELLSSLHIDGDVTATHITASGNISVTGNITTQGDIIAENYIVSSSVTHLTQSYSSGSTVFGNTSDDTHQFTGSLSMTGDVIPSTDATVDLGSDTKRFANLYTADIQLSNEQKGPNDIDGTTGKWTIQEGENDLFLINRRTGAKFKFIIEQVG